MQDWKELKRDLEEISRQEVMEAWEQDVEHEAEKVMEELEQNPASMMDYMHDDEQRDLLYEILLRERSACILWDIAECIDNARERISRRIAENAVEEPAFPIATDDKEGLL